ncbi:TNF receptor-associated factor 4 [Chamberlinius hualienensis]
MAEGVVVDRDYTKEFTMYMINERFVKMENYFKLKLERLEQLINSNIQKTNLTDRTFETVQSNDLKKLKTTQTNFHNRLTKLEGKSKLLFKAIEKKNQQINQKKIQLNRFEDSLKKLSDDFTEFKLKVENENKQLTESVKDVEIKNQQLNENIEIIKTDLQQNCTLLNEEIVKVKTKIEDVTDNLQYEINSQCHQLEQYIKNKEEDNCNKFKDMEGQFKIAEKTNLFRLQSLPNLFKDEKQQTDDVLFAEKTIDEQQQTIKSLKIATNQWTNVLTTVNNTGDDVKEVISRFCFLIGDFHEEKISSYMTTYPPDLTWKINGIKKIIQNEMIPKSQYFELIGYPVKAQVQFYIHSTDVFISLICDSDFELLKVKPQVTFILKTFSGNIKHIIRRVNVYYNDIHHNSCILCDVSWLNRYAINNSITVDVHFEPPSISQSYASTNGILFWKIKNYQQKKQNEICGLIKCEQSPYFYTSPNGYRVMVNMCLNGDYEYKGKGLSVYITFLTGEHDLTLSGSFSHKTTFILFNQKDSSKNYQKTVEKEDKTYAQYYSMDLLAHKELKKGFIKDDCLLIKVMIEPN